LVNKTKQREQKKIDLARQQEREREREKSFFLPSFPFFAALPLCELPARTQGGGCGAHAACPFSLCCPPPSPPKQCARSSSVLFCFFFFFGFFFFAKFKNIPRNFENLGKVAVVLRNIFPKYGY